MKRVQAPRVFPDVVPAGTGRVQSRRPTVSRYIEDPSDPDHVIDLEEVDAVARARAERDLAALPLDASRLEQLKLDEAHAADEAPPEPSPPAPRRRAGLILVLYAVFLVPALLVRVLTAPWRARLLWRARRREDRARTRAIESALALARDVARAPDNVGTRLELGVALLAANDPARAEAEFDAYVSRLEEPVQPRETRAASELGVALQNRGVARLRLRLPRLAARDMRRRAALIGPIRTTLRVRVIEGYRMLSIGLRAMAGLDE